MLCATLSSITATRLAGSAALLLVFPTFLLGCAEVAPPEGNKPVVAAPVELPQQTEPTAAASMPPPTAPAALAPQERIAPDGTVAEFLPDATELSERAFIIIGNLSDSAAKAKLVEIIGYCDKNGAGKNAKSVALARAAAVRDELTKLGVPAKKFRIKFVTTEVRNAVVVILK